MGELRWLESELRSLITVAIKLYEHALPSLMRASRGTGFIIEAAKWIKIKNWGREDSALDPFSYRKLLELLYTKVLQTLHALHRLFAKTSSSTLELKQSVRNAHLNVLHAISFDWRAFWSPEIESWFDEAAAKPSRKWHQSNNKAKWRLADTICTC